MPKVGKTLTILSFLQPYGALFGSHVRSTEHQAHQARLAFESHTTDGPLEMRIMVRQAAGRRALRTYADLACQVLLQCDCSSTVRSAWDTLQDIALALCRTRLKHEAPIPGAG
ncbi:hypothetical protein EV356DRAFT_238152 [Viridothelium virens]|uniref:Uncharacterized protein n=1 Tax=Viridothelium virens TaxID=1048519 RepID=A0A6A6H4V2_VIRVR|nr:hypothetical protein EV356DRAFT_238152 [Viridothelium virens]